MSGNKYLVNRSNVASMVAELLETAPSNSRVPGSIPAQALFISIIGNVDK